MAPVFRHMVQRSLFSSGSRYASSHKVKLFLCGVSVAALIGLHLSGQHTATLKFQLVNHRSATSQMNVAPVTYDSSNTPLRFGQLTHPLSVVSQLARTISLPIVTANSGLHPNGAMFVIYTTPAQYERATIEYFGASAGPAAADTGGFTVGSAIDIPLYKYASTPVLANTTTHELTHVMLNQSGLGQVLPTWINEGFAWYNGMQAQRELSPSTEQTLAKQLSSQLGTAQQHGELSPLDSPVAQILRMNHIYNVEFVDYLAVRQLIKVHGLSAFHAFLHDIPRYGVDFSFAFHFHTKRQQFETAFIQSLQHGLPKTGPE